MIGRPSVLCMQSHNSSLSYVNRYQEWRSSLLTVKKQVDAFPDGMGNPLLVRLADGVGNPLVPLLLGVGNPLVPLLLGVGNPLVPLLLGVGNPLVPLLLGVGNPLLVTLAVKLDEGIGTPLVKFAEGSGKPLDLPVVVLWPVLGLPVSVLSGGVLLYEVVGDEEGVYDVLLLHVSAS